MRPAGLPGRGAGARDGSWSARGADRLLQLLEEFVETVVALIDAIGHARLDHPVAVGDRLEHRVALDAAAPAAEAPLVAPGVALEIAGPHPTSEKSPAPTAP